MLTYKELIKLSTFEERYRYLMSAPGIGPDHPEFLMERFVNQKFYRSHEWQLLKTHILVRDEGMDLALRGYPAGERESHYDPDVKGQRSSDPGSRECGSNGLRHSSGFASWRSTCDSTSVDSSQAQRSLSLADVIQNGLRRW